MLSCDTFLWWMAGSVYAFNDPDEIGAVVISRATNHLGGRKSYRLAIVCGGNFVDSDVFDDSVAAAGPRSC
jgi:hypothetical protein